MNPYLDDDALQQSVNAFQVATTDAANAASVTAATLASLYQQLVRYAEEEQERQSPKTFWSPEPPVAWRCWSVNPRELKLTGMNGVYWDGPTLVAIHSGAPSSHKSPQWRCYCGINASKTIQYLLGSYPGQAVYGTVELSGTVHEYEHGYRAEKATIKELYAEPDIENHIPGIVGILNARYEVEVIGVPRGTFSQGLVGGRGGGGGGSSWGSSRWQASSNISTGGSGGSGTWTTPHLLTTGTITSATTLQATNITPISTSVSFSPTNTSVLRDVFDRMKNRKLY